MSNLVNTELAGAPPREGDSANPVAVQMDLPGMLTYEGACVRILQIVGGMDATPVTPDLAVLRVQAFFDNTHVQVKSLHDCLGQQDGVLQSLAKLSGLEQGHLYTEMLDIFAAWKPEQERSDSPTESPT